MRKSKHTSFDRSLCSSFDEIIRFYSIVCDMSERLYSDLAEPSPFYKVMDKLARACLYFRHYTQNINYVERLLPDLDATTIRLYSRVD
jgi:NAD-dependent SIR2 family protein deacetylase